MLIPAVSSSELYLAAFYPMEGWTKITGFNVASYWFAPHFYTGKIAVGCKNRLLTYGLCECLDTQYNIVP